MRHIKYIGYLFYTLIFISAGSCIDSREKGIAIERTSYLGRDHFRIKTPSATYYYDIAGGGFSSLIDRKGRDWIAFSHEPWDTYPASAASSYRGIPNFVFKSDDSGAGHPGHDQCQSEQTGPRTILTTSVSGKWQWQWTFYESHAEVNLLAIDPDHPYWFLYEGTPAGTFEPEYQYFGHDQTDEPLRYTYDYFAGDKLFGNWRWAWFGHENHDEVLLVMQREPDRQVDTFSYLGNSEAGTRSGDGMVVFGFGRQEGAIPLLDSLHTFYLGLLQISDQKDPGPEVRKFILEHL